MSSVQSRESVVEKSMPRLRRNLLHYPSVATVLRSRWHPGILQAITTAFYGLIFFQLLTGPKYAEYNLGMALTWVLWWPMLPITFLLLGRFWCTICPFGMISDLVQKFIGNQRAVPKFLKKYGIWIINALFILITWIDFVWGIDNSPWRSVVLLLSLTVGVVICSVFFKRRTWCRYLCFLGGLASNYSRVSMLQLRANPLICATCKSCAACYKGNANGPGCPMFEYPRSMNTSAHCNLCAACIKTCPNGSPQLTVCIPTQELWFIRKPKIEEALLAVVLMGIILVQHISVLYIWQSILGELEHLANKVVILTITLVIAMLIPILLLGLATLVAKTFNHASLLSNFARFGYAFIPLDLASHIAHNLLSLLAEGKSIVFTAFPLFGLPIPESSTGLVSLAVIQVIQCDLVALGVIASLYTAYRIAYSNRSSLQNVWLSFAPYAVLILMLGAINTFIFMLPIAMLT